MSSIADFEKTSARLEEGASPDAPSSASPTSPTLTNSSTQSSWFRTGSAAKLWSHLASSSKITASAEANALPNAAASESETVGPRTRVPVPSKKPLKVRSLQRFATGYPLLAAFADSDESYMVYRRFGYLQSRILLEKQDNLRRLEERLDRLDDEDIVTDAERLEVRDEQTDEKRNLLIDIENAFCDYARIVGAAQQFMGAQRPTRSEHQNVLHFIDNRPVHPDEYNYVYWKEDLFSLRPGREMAWLDRGIEKALKWMHCRVIENIFGSKETRLKSNNKNHIYYDRDRINTFASSIITTMILFLLVVPIYLLYHLVVTSHGPLSPKRTGICIGILLVFTLIFSAIMSWFTRARRHEILAAAAAYCAVLVVFMGNVGNNN